MKRERTPFSWRPRVLATRWWYEFRRKRSDLPWFKRVRRRFLLWLPIAVPAILILGSLSLYVGIGLRARYLVSEGMRSIEQESFARGYRQIMWPTAFVPAIRPCAALGPTCAAAPTTRPCCPNGRHSRRKARSPRWRPRSMPV